SARASLCRRPEPPRDRGGIRARRGRRAQASQSRARAASLGHAHRGDRMMRTAHDDVMEDLAALVAGDATAIAKHAEHLASCDQCRDAKHEATQLAAKLADAGADYVPPADLVERVLAKVDAQAAEKATAAEKPAADHAATKPAT